MSKIILGDEAVNKLQTGLNKLAEAVKTTLGPSGKTVIIRKEDGDLHVTKDGATVAKSIQLDDPYENIGAELVNNVAARTANVAGDGTTTATILAQKLVEESTKIDPNANQVDLKKGMKLAVKDVFEEIDARKREVNPDMYRDIALISTNGDEELAELAAEAVTKVGHEGVVTMETTASMTSEVVVKQGAKYTKGYVSPHFVTNKVELTATLSDALVLLADTEITTAKEILPVMEIAANNKKPILIMANKIEGEALATLVLNTVNGNIKAVAVETPGYGGMKQEMIQDIASLTGATIVTGDADNTVEYVTRHSLGSISKSVSDKTSTTIVADGNTEDAIELRIKQLTAQIEQAPDEYAINKLEERIARLKSQAAVIYISGMSEVEIGEKKDRVEDAICAIRSAAEDGVIVGGGTTLALIGDALSSNGDNDAQKLGYSMVRKSLIQPITQLLSNSGLDADSRTPIIRAVLKDKDIIYNAKTHDFEGVENTDILDPAKVTKTALESAVSIAETILNSKGIICNLSDI